MSDRDYYEILGLTPRADGAMVDQAYWHLARKYQQLGATNARAQYMLDELNEAYGVLGTPRLRHQYDAFRDDVLVTAGMIQPVRSKPGKRAQDKGQAEAREFAMPRLSLRHWKLYLAAAAMGALAITGAWLGLSVVIVAAALLLAGGLAAAPSVIARLASIQLQVPSVSMPSMQMPSVSMPSMQAPRLNLPTIPNLANLPDVQVPGLRDLALTGPARDEPMDADELRMSTAATIARWRKSVGLRPPEPVGGPAGGIPDHTLVDIVSSEHEVATDGEPLNAVMDILRGAGRRPEP